MLEGDIFTPPKLLKQGHYIQETPGDAPTIDLKSLIDRCVLKDRKAQEVLYRMLHGKLLGLCLRYFKNRDDALNVMNQGFLKVFNNLKNYDHNYDLEGWAYRIVQNTALDQIKSASRRLKWEQTSELQYDIAVETNFLDHLYAQDIMQLLQKLPEASSVVFNLHVIDGYPHQEISKLLDISVGTSKWHVNNAKTKLKEMIVKLQHSTL